MPKVSIIMPLYNKETYITSSVESVLRQTFYDYELIVVDDGSTDRSAEIVQNYANQDNRIRLVKIKNSGVSNARNVGLSQAEGEWIQFLDADDQIDREYLFKSMKILEKEAPDILFSDFWMVNPQGKKVRQITSDLTGDRNQKELCDTYISLQDKNGFFGFISNKLFKRSLLMESGASFSVKIKLAEDLDFYSQIYPYAQKVYFSSVCSFYYLQTNENYLYDTKIDYLIQLQIQLHIRKWFQKIGTYNKYKEYLDKKVADYIYYSLFYAFEEKQNCEREYAAILENKDAMACIKVEQHRGFSKQILASMGQENKKRIEHLLRSRMLVRKIYRRIRNCE